MLRRPRRGARSGIELHPELAEAIEAELCPREDRDPAARRFASSGADAFAHFDREGV